MIARIAAARPPAQAPSGIRCASAPSGTAAADRLAVVHTVSAPRAASRRSAARARPVLPHPAAPTTTTPEATPAPWAAIRSYAETISSSSRFRPTMGHRPASTMG
jgi:hypothetical protein